MTDFVQGTMFIRPDPTPATSMPSRAPRLPDGPPDLLVLEEMTRLPPDVWARLNGTGLSALAALSVAEGFVLLKHFPAARIVCIPATPGDEAQAWDLAAYVRFKAPRIGIVLLGDGPLAPDLRFSPVANVCTCRMRDRNLPDLLRSLATGRD